MMIITGNNRSGSWHIGENMHIPDGRVLTFQVDGDELYWLKDTIQEMLDAEELKLIWPSEHLTPIL